MGKKFMGYDNASELITAIGNKIKAKYTKPDTGIPKSHLASAVQTSLGKADTAVQNSSLVEIVDNGAKNVLNFDALGSSSATTSYSTVYAAAGVEFTLNTADNTITMKRTSSSTSPVYCALFLNGGLVDCADLCDDNHYLSGCPSGGSNTTFELMLGTVNYRDYGNGVLLSTPSSSITSGIYALIIARPAFTGTVTFKPMICTKSQFDISPAYEPYALGNQILTPALVDQVDGGAKNTIKYDMTQLAALNPSWTVSGSTIQPSSDTHITFTLNSDMSIRVQSDGSNAQAELCICTSTYSPLKAGTYVLSGCPTGGNSSTTYDIRLIEQSSPKKYNADKGSGYEIPWSAQYIYTCNIMVRANQNIDKTFKPMICTLADWRVSQKFVPYRPDWDLVGKKTLLSNQCIAGNLSEFNFDVHDYNSGAGATAARYRHGLLVGGTNANDPILYHVFLDAQNVVTLTPILQGARTFTATCSNDVLTITANIVVYGGLRLIWLD